MLQVLMSQMKQNHKGLYNQIETKPQMLVCPKQQQTSVS